MFHRTRCLKMMARRIPSYEYKRQGAKVAPRGGPDTRVFDEPYSYRTALVMGSSGCLGSTVSKYFSETLGMQVIGADVVDPKVDEEGNATCHHFVKLQDPEDFAVMNEQLTKDVGTILVESNDDDDNDGDDEVPAITKKLDVIFVASGGWEQDVSSMELDTYTERMSGNFLRMMQMNLFPVMAATNLARHYMTDREGLMVVMGALAALQPTTGMMAYGVSKAAAHHVVQTLGGQTLKADNAKTRRARTRDTRNYHTDEYLDELSVVGILPTVLDTPANRKAMPDQDVSLWTNPMDIAEEIGAWIEKPILRPHSGSLIKVAPRSTGGSAFWPIR